MLNGAFLNALLIRSKRNHRNSVLDLGKNDDYRFCTNRRDANENTSKNSTADSEIQDDRRVSSWDSLILWRGRKTDVPESVREIGYVWAYRISYSMITHRIHAVERSLYYFPSIFHSWTTTRFDPKHPWVLCTGQWTIGLLGNVDRVRGGPK